LQGRDRVITGVRLNRFKVRLEGGLGDGVKSVVEVRRCDRIAGGFGLGDGFGDPPIFPPGLHGRGRKRHLEFTIFLLRRNGRGRKRHLELELLEGVTEAGR
jgi:hypothetical protein